MTQTLPVIAAPEPQLIHAVIAYNAFDPEDCTRITIDHAPDKTLADYLGGPLPEEADWAVGVNGGLIEPEHWSTVTLSPGDYLTVSVRPHGGQGGGKMVLRLVAMIAVMVVAWYAAPALAGAFFGGSSIAAGVIGATIPTIGSFKVNQETAP